MRFVASEIALVVLINPPFDQAALVHTGHGCGAFGLILVRCNVFAPSLPFLLLSFCCFSFFSGNFDSSMWVLWSAASLPGGGATHSHLRWCLPCFETRIDFACRVPRDVQLAAHLVEQHKKRINCALCCLPNRSCRLDQKLN